MRELDADGVKLKEDKDTEEVVEDEEGGEVDRAEEDEEWEEEEGGLSLVDEGDVEDDQVKVVADHDQLLQQDDHEGIYVDNTTTKEHGGESGKDGSDEKEEGDAELGQPDVPDEEEVLELGLLVAEVGGGE